MNKKNFLYFTLPSLFNVFIGIALLPLYTKILGPEDFGLIAIFTVIFGLVLSLSDNGAGWVLAANFHKKNFDLKIINFQLIFSSFVIKTVIIGLFYLFGQEIVNLLGMNFQDVGLIYKIMLLSFIFTLFDSVALSYMVFNEEAKIHMLSQVISSFLFNMTVYVSLFNFNLGVISLVNGLLVSRIFLFIYFLFYMFKKIKISFAKNVFSEIKIIGFPAIYKTTSTYILQNIDKILIQQLGSISSLGIYDFGMKFKGLQETISKSFNRVYGAYFYKSYENFDYKEHIKISNIWLGLNFLLSLSVFFFIDNIIDVLTNGKFNDAAVIVQLFFVSSIINSYSLFYGLVLVAERQTVFITKTSIWVGILSSVSMYFSINFFGLIGILYVLNIASLSILLMYIIRVKKIEGIKFNDFVFMSYLFSAIFLLIFRNYTFNSILVIEEFIALLIIYALIAIPIAAAFFKNINFFFNKNIKL